MISVIIPVLNEEQNIGELINLLKEKNSGYVSEIIVVDGGSSDQTPEIASRAGAKVIYSSTAGRSTQMNKGASEAVSEILYFLHADTTPPDHYDRHIKLSLTKGSKAGCFRLRFDDSNKLLKLYGWFTRFRGTIIRFGDQSLFISKQLFHSLEGFREDFLLMEDQEMVSRIKGVTEFKILEDYVVTSARKYRQNGVVRLQFIFSVIVLFYYFGMKQETILHLYKTLINSKKI